MHGFIHFGSICCGRREGRLIHLNPKSMMVWEWFLVSGRLLPRRLTCFEPSHCIQPSIVHEESIISLWESHYWWLSQAAISLLSGEDHLFPKSESLYPLTQGLLSPGLSPSTPPFQHSLKVKTKSNVRHQNLNRRKAEKYMEMPSLMCWQWQPPEGMVTTYNICLQVFVGHVFWQKVLLIR